MATKSNRSSGSQHNQRGIAQGNTLVDPKTGFPVCVKEDAAGDYRLCVDASLTVDHVDINVALDVIEDGVHIGDMTTGDTLTVNPDGSIDTNTEVDAADGDNIAISAHPSQIFDEAADTLTTTGYEEIYNYTSADNSTRVIAVEATAGTPSTFRLKINGTVVRVLRSSPLERNITFFFREHRSLANGDILTVEARVERLIQTSYDTFTSLEGYLI